MTEQAKTYHHGDLRTALLDEAADMIADGGVASVTMRALGQRLGVSRAAPYRHFEDKDALIVAIAAAGFSRLGERMGSIEAGAKGSGIRRLRAFGEQYVRFALENPAQYRVMYGKEALARQDHPDLRAAGNALFEQLVAVFEAHQKSGDIKRQDPRAQAYVAWGAMHGLASLLIDGQIMAPVDVDALIRQATRTMVEGMRSSRRGE